MFVKPWIKFCVFLGMLCVLAACSETKVASQSTPKPIVVPSSQKPLATSFDKVAYLSDKLAVRIQSGSVNFHNIDGDAPYVPVTVILNPGETKKITLTKPGQNFFDSKTALTLQYTQGVLMVDTAPNPFGLTDTCASPISFPLRQQWLVGETYTKVNTVCEAGLREVSIRVKLIR